MTAMAPAMERVSTPARRSVCLVLHKFSRGGSDRVAAHLARGFRDAGLAVELVVVCAGGEVDAVLADVVGPEIPITYLSRAWGPRPLELAAAMPALAEALRDRAPTDVISTANNTALVTAVALRLARLPGCRLFLKTTNPIASSRHRGLLRALRLWSYRLIFRWTDGVWTLTPQESDEMRLQFPEHASLFRDVANPYVTSAMLAPTSPPLASSGRPTVITVARLTAQKRLDRLIAAFAKVRHPHARLLILGEGEDRPALTAQVAALGLQDRVQMPGYTRDVAAALHAADLFVLTSDYEGLPAAVLEAMAANCPVLCTDCFPGAAWVVGARDGCALIDADDPAAVAAAIDERLTRLRPQSLRAFADRFSITNGVESHLSAMSTEPALVSEPRTCGAGPSAASS